MFLYFEGINYITDVLQLYYNYIKKLDFATKNDIIYV